MAIHYFYKYIHTSYQVLITRYFKVATNDCLIAYAKSFYINCPNCTVAMAEVANCYNKLITEEFRYDHRYLIRPGL